MVFGDSQSLFAVLVVDVGLKKFEKTDKGEGSFSFTGILPGDRMLYGEYKQDFCAIYIQRKQYDPLYPLSIPGLNIVQISLCDFFECDSKSSDHDPEYIRDILGLGYFSLIWGNNS